MTHPRWPVHVISKINLLTYLKGYHKRLTDKLPQLQILDGLDRQGKTAAVDEIMADIPGLDQYLEYLVSSSSSVRFSRNIRHWVNESDRDIGIVIWDSNFSQDLNPITVATPNIDAALDHFKQRGVTPDISTSATVISSATEVDSSYQKSPSQNRSTKSTPTKVCDGE